MADEKILEEELLDDEELENVAGGTLKETLGDRDQLTKIGMYNFDGKKGFVGSVQDGIAQLGKTIGCDLKITCDASLNKDTANVYQIGNQNVSRETFWATVDRLLPAKK